MGAWFNATKGGWGTKAPVERRAACSLLGDKEVGLWGTVGTGWGMATVPNPGMGHPSPE